MVAWIARGMPCPIFAGLRSAFSVNGDSALGKQAAKSQDFTLINQEKFAFARSDEFVDFVVAAANGNGALLKFLIKRYGLFGGPARIAQMLKTVSKRLGGFATGSAVQQRADGLWTLMRYRCVCAGLIDSSGKATPGANKDWGSDFSARLRQQALHWDMQLQPLRQ